MAQTVRLGSIGYIPHNERRYSYNTIKNLFEQPWGQGYPPSQAKRKIRNAQEVKNLNVISKKSMIDIIPKIDPDLIFPVLNYEPIYNFIIKNGTDQKLISIIKRIKNDYKN